MKYPIIDLHTDYVLACYEKGKQFKSDQQINDKMLDKTNIRLVFAGFSYDDLLKDTDLQFKVLHQQLMKVKNLKLVLTKQNLSDLFESKNRGMIIHMEGAGILNNSMQKFQQYYHGGLRSIGLTHSRKNCLAAGNKENPKLPLTAFGKQIIKTSHQQGVVVDLAHLNEKGFYQALKNGTRPFIVSHTCAYKLCPDPRNLKDEQIKEIARQKGVVGIFFSSQYVRNDGKKATIDDVVNHFVHIASVGGVDVLAIGSDFGGITTGTPYGLENTTKLTMLINRLKKAGFNNQDIEKISYKNAKRVLLNILK